MLAPDFDTAPKVRHPVSEQRAYDVYAWAHASAGRHGWDESRISVGGASAGTQVAFAVVEQAIEAGRPVPVAVSSEFGVCDLARPDARRTSPKRRPVVSPWLMRLIRDTYFAGADLTDPFVSPFHCEDLGAFPPTLVMTAELDTLRREMNELADKMACPGVDVTHREFAGVDHGFTHARPAAVARAALAMLGEHLRRAYETPTRENGNVAVVRRFIEGAVNGSDHATIDDTWADDLVWHGGSLGTFDGKEEFKDFFAEGGAGAWADMHLEVDELIAHDDKVVARFTNSGTNVGAFLNHPPTGRHAEWLGIGIYTVRDGRITEGWFAEDILGVLIQLDAIAPIRTSPA